jgi:hypothetical protein
MDDSSWTFVRGEERLVIRSQQAGEEALLLAIEGGTEAHTYAFADRRLLDGFQSDMEAMLLQTGWSLAGFEPDRRRGRDRRGWPRVEPDRRRWWTDGQERRNPQAAESRSRSRRTRR